MFQSTVGQLPGWAKGRGRELVDDKQNTEKASKGRTSLFFVTYVQSRLLGLGWCLTF